MAPNQNKSAPSPAKSKSPKNAAASEIQCLICTSIVPKTETQQLTCGHSFCTQCLASVQNVTDCPFFGCKSARMTDVLVDEVDEPDNEPSEIAEKLNRVDLVGPRQPELLKLEERQRCESKKAYLQCVNVARMTLVDCRHRVCFDCITKKISSADSAKELPHCPLARCANLLTKSEVARVAEKFPSIRASCTRIMSLLPDVTDEDRPAPKDEVRVYSTIYNTDRDSKALNLPKICTISDMATALLQLHGLNKNIDLNSIGFFIRTVGETSKARYEQLNLKIIGKKLVRDIEINDKTHLILDLNNEVPK